ncbi:HNH endonuclease signature motif containing protein [Paludisphaera sp.]|uniref:HNH endonuclease n=1 Tax=Paludisphaera sp. TaxID=2017432 RepID=UPI00301D8C55
MSAIDAELARLVRDRAGGRCEYCRITPAFDDRPFEIDHIIARKHQGPTIAANLALSCFRCNSFKGSDLAGLEPGTRKLTPLFNPRRHKWDRHFRWRGAVLEGMTPIGRATIAVLRINDPLRVELREALIAEGEHPGAD